MNDDIHFSGDEPLESNGRLTGTGADEEEGFAVHEEQDLETHEPTIEGRRADGLEDALVDELDIIAEQPLQDRAESFSRIHDRLQAELNGQ